MSAITSAHRSDWLVPGLLILLSLVPAAAGTARLAELMVGAPITEANLRFFASPLPVVLHVLAIVPYSIVGAFQFAPALRRRQPGWHRVAGKVLVVLGLVVAMTGLWMTQFYRWPAGDGELLYLLRLVFGTAMALSIVLAVDALRRHDFAAHGAWMIRSYAIAMGAGTQVLTHIPYFMLVGKPDEASRAVLMGAGWVINVVVAEWLIRKSKSRPRSTSLHFISSIGRLSEPDGHFIASGATCDSAAPTITASFKDSLSCSSTAPPTASSTASSI